MSSLHGRSLEIYYGDRVGQKVTWNYAYSPFKHFIWSAQTVQFPLYGSTLDVAYIMIHYDARYEFWATFPDLQLFCRGYWW